MDETTIAARPGDVIPKRGLRPVGVQSVIAPDIEEALAWWSDLTGLRPAAVGRSADVTVVQLAPVRRRRPSLNVVSGPGAGEFRDVDLYGGRLDLRELGTRVSRPATFRVTPVDDPWSNTVYCLTARGHLFPLTARRARRDRPSVAV